MDKEQIKQHIVCNILPQKYKPFSTPSDLYESGQIVGYNQALQDTHDKLDEVIGYIYADLREKIEKMASHDVDMGDYVVETKKCYIEKQRLLDSLTTNQE